MSEEKPNTPPPPPINQDITAGKDVLPMNQPISPPNQEMTKSDE